jgi:hypothetical protein
MSKLDGGCLCGAARYHADGDAIATAVCHCTNCQKQSGAAFSVNVVVPADAFHLEGDSVASIVTDSDDGGQVDRRFCRECGSPLASLPTQMPFAIIKAGTLDDTSWVEPQMQVFCTSAQPWAPLDAIGEQQLPRGVPTG